MRIIESIRNEVKFYIAGVMRRLIGDYWKPRRCGWPYRSGWATYNSWRNTILDTGLSKEEAVYQCKVLNVAQRESGLTTKEETR